MIFVPEKCGSLIKYVMSVKNRMVLMAVALSRTRTKPAAARQHKQVPSRPFNILISLTLSNQNENTSARILTLGYHYLFLFFM